MLGFGDWTPDLTSYRGQNSQDILNVVPRADGYGPFQDFSAFSTAIDGGNDSFTKVLLHFDGTDAATTFTDSNNGGSAHTWTAAGNAQIDTAIKKFGTAAGLFDGTGDYISTPNHADFALGSGDFTIDGWFYRAGGDGTLRFLCGQSDNSFGTRSYNILLTSTDTFRFEIFISTVSFVVDSTATFTAVGWHHFAAVRTNSVMKLFIDGVQTGGDLAAPGTVDTSTTVLGVGRMGAKTGFEWFGSLDEFRISVGVARWIANFTPPLAPYELNERCRGFFYARKSDGTIAVFAGTSSNLFKLSNTDLSWANVSKSGGPYSALTSTHHWQFAQFGNYVFAVQANVVPQVYDLSSSTAFADLGGSPPQAAYIAIVGRFVVLSGLLSTPYRIQWSGLNATTTWTSGTNSSDYQDLPDGGIVRGAAGGEFGIIFQETTMRRMIYAPGNPIIFQIERITEDKGLLAPYSVIRAGDKIFFLAPQGFYVMNPTGYPEPIGKEKFDRFFFGDYDAGAIHLIIGAADPNSTRVYWAYKSGAGASGLFDRLLCFDYGLNRATLINMTGEYLASLAAPGVTLDALDTISSSIDALTVSLDDISTNALSQLAAVNSDHKAGFFSGAALEARMDTPEQELEHGQRLRVRGLRPVTDAPTCYAAVGARETIQTVVTYSTEQAVNARGLCPANISTRLARGKMRIPAGTTWTFATGLEPESAQEGKR